MDVKTKGHLAHAMNELPASAPVTVMVGGRKGTLAAVVEDGALVLLVSAPEPKKTAVPKAGK